AVAELADQHVLAERNRGNRGDRVALRLRGGDRWISLGRNAHGPGWIVPSGTPSLREEVEVVSHDGVWQHGVAAVEVPHVEGVTLDRVGQTDGVAERERLGRGLPARAVVGRHD